MTDFDHCPQCGGLIRDMDPDGQELPTGQRWHRSHLPSNHHPMAASACWCRDTAMFADHRHDEIDDQCARCGEFTTPQDRAEVADGLVHASCMLAGEEVA